MCVCVYIYIWKPDNKNKQNLNQGCNQLDGGRSKGQIHEVSVITEEFQLTIHERLARKLVQGHILTYITGVLPHWLLQFLTKAITHAKMLLDFTYNPVVSHIGFKKSLDLKTFPALTKDVYPKLLVHHQSLFSCTSEIKFRRSNANYNLWLRSIRRKFSNTTIVIANWPKTPRCDTSMWQVRWPKE